MTISCQKTRMQISLFLIAKERLVAVFAQKDPCSGGRNTDNNSQNCDDGECKKCPVICFCIAPCNFFLW